MTDPTLVTGATGFIGSHVAKQLLDAGEHVRVIVRDPAKLADVGLSPGDRLEVVQGDLLKSDDTRRALDGARRVFHIAGFISTLPRDRQKVRELNDRITRALIDAADETRPEKIVYLASIFALSGGTPEPATERDPWLLADFPVEYVQAKRRAELYARNRAAAGSPLVFVYPCFCYGPGDVYVSSSRIVRSFLLRELPGYVRGGQNAMDVRDAARGLILGMEHGEIGEQYLIGGENRTYDEIFGMLAGLTGYPPPRLVLPAALARLGGRLAEKLLKEPPLDHQAALLMERHWYYDDTKARRELGHSSRPLTDTLRDAITWFCERGDTPWPPTMKKG